MSQTYYYFAASLPAVEWDGKLPMSIAEYLLDCQRLLSEKDYLLIRSILNENDLFDPMGNKTTDAWTQFDRNFRNEMAAFRAKRFNKDSMISVRGMKENEPQLREIVQQAAKLPNLFEAEKLLDQARWQFLDDLANGHYYDFDYLIVYGLKLKILERYEEYRSPQGKALFDEIRMARLPANCVVESNG